LGSLPGVYGEDGGALWVAWSGTTAAGTIAPRRLNDRFGYPVHPRESFLVPLPVIDEAVERIRDGSITGVVCDPKTAHATLLGCPGPL
jgi:hypothetical protein